MGRLVRAVLGNPIPVYVEKQTMDAIERADAILEEAVQEAKQIVERAQAEANTIRVEARQIGLMSATEQMSVHLLRAESARRRFIDSAREEVESSALAVARLLVGHSADLDPVWLAQSVEEHLATLRGARQVTLVCHPGDKAALEAGVTSHVEKDVVELVCDEKVTRGGFRIHSDLGDVDATVEGRVQVLLDALEAQ